MSNTATTTTIKSPGVIPHSYQTAPAPPSATNLLPPRSAPFSNNEDDNQHQARSLSERFSEWRQERLSRIRPWREFIDRNQFSLPADPGILKVRLRRNIEHYASNYLIVVLALLAWSLVTNPVLLISCVVCGVAFAGLMQLPEGEVVSFGPELQVRRQHLLVAWGLGAGIILLVFLDVVLFWVVGASGVITALHAGFHEVKGCALSRFPSKFLILSLILSKSGLINLNVWKLAFVCFTLFQSRLNQALWVALRRAQAHHPG